MTELLAELTPTQQASFLLGPARMGKIIALQQCFIHDSSKDAY
jgi:hypothetical protein